MWCFLPLLYTGYAGTFKQRTGDKKDGCATFFKTDKFELDQAVPVEYYKPGVYCLDRDNVGLLVLLRPQNGHTKVCVANTHLLFNPRRGDIKLAQLMVLFSEIDKLAISDSNAGSLHYHPVIFCGDLNAEPHCDLYRLIVQGSLHYEGLVTKFVSGQERYGGRETYLGKELVPQALGITDQCQYLEVVMARTRKCEERVQQQISLSVAGGRGEEQTMGLCSSVNQESSAADRLQVRSATASKEPSHASPSAEAQEPSAGSCATGISKHKTASDEESPTQLEKPTAADLSQESASNEGKVDTSSSQPARWPDHDGSSWQQPQQFPWNVIQEQINLKLCSSSWPCTATGGEDATTRWPHSTAAGKHAHRDWTQGSGTLSHRLKLTSVYSHEFQEHGHGRYRPRWHKEVTTHHDRANCTVDYMFYSVRKQQTYIRHHKVQTHRVEEGRLRLVAKLRLPSDSRMREVGVLPNKFISSDHVKLMAKFLLKLK